MKIHDNSKDMEQLNEFVVHVQKQNIDDSIQRSIFYPRLKQMMFKEINLYCSNFISLKTDLQFIRMQIGETLNEKEIRDIFDSLMKKYNSSSNDNIGILYHIETGRLDRAVVCTVILKRNEIEAKNFIFRFRKKNMGEMGLNMKAEDQDVYEENILDKFLRQINNSGVQ